jgi:hypothetical protein
MFRCGPGLEHGANSTDSFFQADTGGTIDRFEFGG